MPELNSPNGHILGLGGSFSKNHESISRLFKPWGAHISENADDCTIIVAADADNQKTLIQQCKERGLPFLNADWMHACIKEKKWIEPQPDHFHLKQRSDTVQSTQGSEITDTLSNDAMETMETTRYPTPQISSTAAKEGEPKEVEAKIINVEEGELMEAEAEEVNIRKGETTRYSTPQISSTAAKEGEAKEVEARGGEAKGGEAKEVEAREGEAKGGNAKEIEAKEIKAEEGKAKETAPRKTAAGKIDPWLDYSEGRRTWYNKSSHPFEFPIDIHPDDLYKPKHEQRRRYIMYIDFAIRHFLLIHDPTSSFPSHKNPEKSKTSLKAYWLINRQEAGTAFQNFIDYGGVVLTSSSENLLRGIKMEDFDWWGTASYHGNPCYNVGVLPGESKPRVWPRTSLLKVWGKAADKEINRIRRVFHQSTLDEEKELRRSTGRERSVILENLKESEKYLTDEREA